MKAVILAGGLGTRLREETETKPKPMVEIGGRPILWHVMKIYASHGVTEFVVCLGYKGYVIKEWFANYWLHNSDVTFDLKTNDIEIHHNTTEPWRVTLVDTGQDTMTGGRLARVRHHVEAEERFCFTYGDGVGDVDVTATIDLHRRSGKSAVVTAVSPPARFGALTLDRSDVVGFSEKPVGGDGLINGGFFVLSPDVLDLIAGDQTVWENEPMAALADGRQLVAHSHDGFWHPVDTLRDLRLLDELWSLDAAPWKTW